MEEVKAAGLRSNQTILSMWSANYRNTIQQKFMVVLSDKGSPEEEPVAQRMKSLIYVK